MALPSFHHRGSVFVQDRFEINSHEDNLAFYEDNGEMYISCNNKNGNKVAKISDIIDLLNRIEKLEKYVSEIILIGENNG